MPRPSAVTLDERIALVEKYIDSFKKRPYPKSTENIWKIMSEELNGRWSPFNVFVNVTHDRMNILSTALSNKNFTFDAGMAEVTCNSTMSFCTSNSDCADLDMSIESESNDLDEFTILITNEEWKRMKGPIKQYGEKRTYQTLQPGLWTDILSLALYHQTNLPCAFVFRHSKIYESPGALHYLRIKGLCKSKACGNSIFCYLDEKPGDTDFYLKVKTRDTIWDYRHEDVKRPLRGLRRQEIGQEVFYQGCGNWKKTQVSADTKFGQRIGPHIPNLDVLRQAKKEYVDKKLGIEPLNSQNIIDAIEQMKYKVPYHGFIHEVKREKFLVSFSTSSQLHVYKRYLRKMKNKAVIQVDGTGSIIKPLTRYDGSKSGHIFLYSISINLDETTLPIHEMLTESQDTGTLFGWLTQWQKLGAAKPSTAVCDSSRALLNALSLAFNYQTIKTYVETCFLYSSKNDEYYYRPTINTYIRIDVAHLMNMVRKWDCVKDMRHKAVRRLYLYAVALMVDSQKLEDFREIFLLTCTVASHECADTKIETVIGETVDDAREKLEKYIENRQFPIKIDVENIFDPKNRETSNEDENDTMSGVDRSYIKEYISQLLAIAKKSRILGTKPNPFFCNDFIDRFLPLAYEFPLWSSAALPKNTKRASSASIEGYFNDLKNRILKNYTGLLRADKFLKIMFQNHSGSATILASKLRINNVEKENFSNELPIVKIKNGNNSKLVSSSHDSEMVDDDSEKNIEHNFKESEKNVKRKCGYYYQPQPDICHRNKRIKDIDNLMLLKNGNNFNQPTVIDKQNYFAKNTCPFDSIIQILCTAAMDESAYFTVINSSRNETMKFIINLIKRGTCADIYKERCKLLKNLFSSAIKLYFVESRSISSFSIDMWNNPSVIWTTCFQSESSAIDMYHCSVCGPYSVPIFVLCVNHDIIKKNVGALEKALLSVVGSKKLLPCRNQGCIGRCSRQRIYNNQIFIELDIREDINATSGMRYELTDFSIQLNLNNDEYRLAGVIAQLPGHYVAYCKRIDNTWELCNDMSDKVIRCKKSKKVEPSAVIYVKIEREKVLSCTLENSQNCEGSFPVKEPFNDSDTQSHDNWRNKGEKDESRWDESPIITKKTSKLSALTDKNFLPTIIIDNKVCQIKGIKKIEL